MSDTMTLYQGEKQTVIPIEPQPDTDHPGKFLIKNLDGAPLCGEFSLKEHAYNVVLSPGSTIIIDSDNAEMFAQSHSDDHVIFILPTDNSEEFYLEKYFANAPDTTPHAVLALRYQTSHTFVSAVLYPRDLEKLPKPFFLTQGGKNAVITTKGMEEKQDPDAKAEFAHHPDEAEFIFNAIFKPTSGHVAAVDPNTPKQEWI